jgi:hypothetical protein
VSEDVLRRTVAEFVGYLRPAKPEPLGPAEAGVLDPRAGESA